jgi:hypothetical protein
MGFTAINSLIAEKNAAFARLKDSTNSVDTSGFARTIWTDEENSLTLIYVNRQIIYQPDLTVIYGYVIYG